MSANAFVEEEAYIYTEEGIRLLRDVKDSDKILNYLYGFSSIEDMHEGSISNHTIFNRINLYNYSEILCIPSNISTARSDLMKLVERKLQKETLYFKPIEKVNPYTDSIVLANLNYVNFFGLLQAKYKEFEHLFKKPQFIKFLGAYLLCNVSDTHYKGSILRNAFHFYNRKTINERFINANAEITALLHFLGIEYSIRPIQTLNTISDNLFLLQIKNDNLVKFLNSFREDLNILVYMPSDFLNDFFDFLFRHYIEYKEFIDFKNKPFYFSKPYSRMLIRHLKANKVKLNKDSEKIRNFKKFLKVRNKLKEVLPYYNLNIKVKKSMESTNPTKVIYLEDGYAYCLNDFFICHSD